MNAAESFVREFCDAWTKLDPDLIVGYFAEDAVYHNMPLPPLKGHAAIKDFLVGFLANVTSAEFTIHHLVADGDLVFTERTDAFTLGGKHGAFPVCGVFELEGGKIKAWRDYFDMAQVTSFLAGA